MGLHKRQPWLTFSLIYLSISIGSAKQVVLYRHARQCNMDHRAEGCHLTRICRGWHQAPTQPHATPFSITQTPTDLAASKKIAISPKLTKWHHAPMLPPAPGHKAWQTRRVPADTQALIKQASSVLPPRALTVWHHAPVLPPAPFHTRHGRHT